MEPSILGLEAVRRALNLRDLTNPEDGPHGLQIIVHDILEQLRSKWACEVKLHRECPIVSIEDNYDRLHYPRDGAARDARYTRYVCATALLRTMTSAAIPKAMRLAAKKLPDTLFWRH
jgi:phenylalanyl-tRNA synthetase alpha chain